MIYLKLLFTTLLIAILFSECKKGEHDPTVSFRTRKNRITGRWQITSGSSNYSQESTANGSSAQVFTYGESTFTYSDGPYSYYKGSYSQTMKIEKNGTFSVTEAFDGISSTYRGTWDFNHGIGDKKNKEQLLIHFTSKENHNGTYTYAGTNTDMTYDIIELRNSKLVLYSKYKLLNPDGSTANYVDSYEFKQ